MTIKSLFEIFWTRGRNPPPPPQAQSYCVSDGGELVSTGMEEKRLVRVVALKTEVNICKR